MVEQALPFREHVVGLDGNEKEGCGDEEEGHEQHVADDHGRALYERWVELAHVRRGHRHEAIQHEKERLASVEPGRGRKVQEVFMQQARDEERHDGLEGVEEEALVEARRRFVLVFLFGGLTHVGIFALEDDAVQHRSNRAVPARPECANARGEEGVLKHGQLLDAKHEAKSVERESAA